MRFTWLVAWRFLREGRTQTLLILAGIGVGVGVIVFLSALITGLQQSIVDRTLGTQPHIILRAPEDEARPQRPPLEATLPHVQQPAQRLRTILGWPQVLRELRTAPGITAASPTVAGSGFALRGTASKAIALRGIEPDSYRDILDLRTKLISGSFELSGTNALIGTELARELGIAAGDRVRITSSADRTDVFTIAGIFDIGNKELNARWVFVSLRQGQTLLDLAGGVSTLEVRVSDLFAAEGIAQDLASRTGLIAESWMRLNAQLLVGLRSQSASSGMIQFFVIVAVTLGIASVLVVSVVQKSRQIGILRATGVSRAQVRKIFLIQGGALGLSGSLAGLLLGVGLALVFQSLARNPDGSPTFPVNLDAPLFLRATLTALATGLVGAWLPARRAAALDPAVAIRHD